MTDPLDQLIADKRAEVADLKRRIGTLDTELATLELASSLRPPAVAAAAANPPAPAAPVAVETTTPPVEVQDANWTPETPAARKGRLFGS